MKLSFRQGIVRHQKTIAGDQQFLEKSITGGISLVAIDAPTIVTIAHGDRDYLHTEAQSITDAWPGPFTPLVDYWLYWDIDLVTGNRTFGHTLYQPVFSLNVPLTPVIDQHWFDLNTNTMRVWTGSSWVTRLRVFACKYEDGAIITKLDSMIEADFTGTQVSLDVPATAGGFIYDANGIAVKVDGFFFTTEDIFVTGLPSSSQLRLESILSEGEAQVPLAAYSAVRFNDFGQIVQATPIDLGTGAVGIIEQDVVVGDVVTFITEGIVTHNGWNWSAVNIPVYINQDGLISETPGVPPVPVGVVVSEQAILFRNPAFGVVDLDVATPGGGGSSGPHNAIALETNTDPVVIETADPPLPGQVLYAISPTQAIWKYITTEDVVVIAQSIEINGPDTIYEDSVSSGPYSATVSFSDGTQQVVIPTWNIVSPDITANIDGANFITVGTTPVQVTLELEASFTDLIGTVVQTSKTITAIILDSVSIAGPANVYENDSGQYDATAHWSDGSMTPLTSGVGWSEDNSSTTIDSNGLMLVGPLTVDGIVYVNAEYTFASQTKFDNIPVAILDNFVQSLLISGPTSVPEGDLAQYTAVATWRDGSNADVTTQAIWSLDVGGSIATIDGNGQMTTFGVPGNTAVEISADYTSDTILVQDTHNVTIQDIPPLPRYGIGAAGQSDEAIILALPNTLPSYNDGQTFDLTTGPGEKMYFASLVSEGEVTFVDTSNGFPGGWDAAGQPGPIIVQVTIDTIVYDMYLYETDFDNLGTVEFQVTFA